jgi:hypothetical protein
VTDLRLSFLLATKGFDQAIAELNKPIATTATAAMDDAKTMVKIEAREDIARAGFSKRWQNALRVDRYPKGNRVSMEAAVFLFHRIPYAGVFEDGAKIQGNPLLWIPLSTTPQKIGRNRTTPKRVDAIIPGDLVPIRSRSGIPLMGATVRVSRTQAMQDRPKVTLAALRRGREGTGFLRTIPLFFGVRVAEVRKQLNIRQICEKARDRIPRFYAKNFREN